MSNSAAEESPHKRRKTCPPPSPLSLLPDEMVLSCMSRVSRSDQAALSLVSRSYRSLVASPELYKMRSLLGRTENCVYVCLRSPPEPTPRWFFLLRANRLLSPIPIPSFPSQAPEGSSVVALDWGIYVIGGLIKGKPTSDVLLLDCRTHTWRQVPSMGVGRVSAAAGVVDGKIYVFGGCYDPDSSNWAEVYDPKTQTWDALPAMPDHDTRCQLFHDSVVVKEEKVYAVDLMETTYYYSPGESKWGRGNDSELRGYKRDWCVIDKIIYSGDQFGELYWCEQVQLECSEPEREGMYWRKVQGLGSLKASLFSSRLVHFDGRFEATWESRKIGYGVDYKLIDVLPGVRLSKSGPNLVLFWDVIEGDHLEIWCAEISLERRQKGAEIWGNIEWSHPVMTVEPFLHHYKVHAYERINRIYNYTLDPCGPVYITIGDGGNIEKVDVDFADDPGKCPSPGDNVPEIGGSCPLNFTYGPAKGKFCWDRQPDWSAFRESSFGHGILEVVNSTHALWTWQRNQDVYKDEATVTKSTLSVNQVSAFPL